MDIITAENLGVRIGDKAILQGVNLVVPQGKITVLIGPNGSGKSTTLKALCRLLPYEGSVQFKGRELKGIAGSDFAKEVALMAQNPLAPDDLTVLDLVKMGRFPHHKFWRGSSWEDGEKVATALEETGLKGFQNRILTTLSGGERQRAWIAMALAQEPKVLFLDEPTSYLDINHQLEVLGLVRKLNRNRNLTVVMVLHDLTQTLNIADWVTVIKNGRTVMQGEASVIDTQLMAEVFQVEAEEFWASSGEKIVIPLRKCR